MKSILFLFSFFVVQGCAFHSPKNTKTTADLKNTSYTIVNLQHEFVDFWNKAQRLNFEQQVQLWDEIVERPHQAFYDSIVYSKSSNPDWKGKKLNRLRRYFNSLPEKYEQNLEVLKNFDTTVERQVQKFHGQFPDSNFKIKIYAIPGATFNGRTAIIEDTKEFVLAFGVNVMIDIQDDDDVLYSHELFHVYHNEKIESQGFSPASVKMTLPLWKEGLAVFVSREMNPNKTFDKIFMSKDLPQVSKTEIKWLADEFLKIAETPTEHSKNYPNWFNYGPQLRKNIPTRAGYLLGYHVASEIGKKHSTFEMSGWPQEKIHTEVVLALKKISAGKIN